MVRAAMRKVTILFRRLAVSLIHHRTRRGDRMIPMSRFAVKQKINRSVTPAGFIPAHRPYADRKEKVRSILNLQQASGNQAVQGLLRSGANPSARPGRSPGQRTPATRDASEVEADKAASAVIARKASNGAIRCSGPSSFPAVVTRLTAVQTTLSISIPATGASWCNVILRSRSKADRDGSILAARSGPRNRSRCRSPQK